MNRRLAFSLLGVAAVFALLTLYFERLAQSSPVKTIPTLNVEIPIGISDPSKYLQRALALYRAAEAKYSLYQHDLLAAGGFGVLTVIVLLWGVGQFGPASLRRCLRASIFVLSAVLGAFYLSIVLWDLNMNILWFFPFTGLIENPNFFVSMSPGAAAIVSFICATVGFTIFAHELQGGWLRPFWNIVRFFCVPMVLILELGLLIIYPYVMSLFVVSFITWSYGGVYVLSNWNVLYVTLLLAALGYIAQPLLTYVVLPARGNATSTTKGDSRQTHWNGEPRSAS